MHIHYILKWCEENCKSLNIACFCKSTTFRIQEQVDVLNHLDERHWNTLWAYAWEWTHSKYIERKIKNANGIEKLTQRNSFASVFCDDYNSFMSVLSFAVTLMLLLFHEKFNAFVSVVDSNFFLFFSPSLSLSFSFFRSLVWFLFVCQSRNSSTK